MKKIIKTIAALSAAVTLAVAPAMNVFAYEATKSNYQNLEMIYQGEDAGISWNLPAIQAGMPELTTKFLGTVSDSSTSSKITLIADQSKFPIYNNSMVAVLGKELNNGSLDMIKFFMDKLQFKIKKVNGSLSPRFIALTYDKNPSSSTTSRWGVQLFNNNDPKRSGNSNINPFDENLDVENFRLDQKTGKYSGDILVYDYYVPRMKFSCGDGYTKFSDPVLKIGYCGEEGLVTVTHFEGTLPNADTLVFGKDATPSTYNILKGITCRYDNGAMGYYSYERQMGTLNFYEKLYYSSNKKYDGILGSTDLITTLTNASTSSFSKNDFVGFKSSGDTLKICVGKNLSISSSSWNSSNGEDKLKVLLNSGYKKAFNNNTWVKNNINKYSRIEFYCNATTTSNGTNFYYCTPAAFSKLLK
jgi:hypothetical protein